MPEVGKAHLRDRILLRSRPSPSPRLHLGPQLGGPGGRGQALRIGGDEFAILLPGVRREQADEIVDRIREQSDATQGILGQVGAGVSAGVVELDSDEAPEALVKRADTRMYDLKGGVARSNTVEIERMEQWCS